MNIWLLELKQTLRLVLKESQLKEEAIGARMADPETGKGGVSGAQLYRWADMNSSEIIPLGRLMQLMEITEDTRPLNILCAARGGVFMRTHGCAGNVDNAIIKVLKETADVLKQATDAMQDGKITCEELARIRKEVSHAHDALAHMEATFTAENRKGGL